MGKIIKFDYMHKNTPVATVTYDAETKVCNIVQHRTKLFDYPIQKPNPSWGDILEFFEERCFPRERANVREVLQDLDLDSYEPYSIVQKTRGQQWDDFYWIRFEGDTAGYEDIKLRD